jgi:predicted Kef-type K+ transport protein
MPLRSRPGRHDRHLIFLGKSILGLLTRAFGYVNMAPWIVGLGLSQVGEFSFVPRGASSGLLKTCLRPCTDARSSR